MSELKLCPCCSGKAIARSEGAYDYGSRNYTVRCTRCKLSTDKFDGEQESIDAWNTRAESEQIKKLTEALDMMVRCIDTMWSEHAHVMTKDDSINGYSQAKDLLAEIKE